MVNWYNIFMRINCRKTRILKNKQKSEILVFHLVTYPMTFVSSFPLLQPWKYRWVFFRRKTSSFFIGIISISFVRENPDWRCWSGISFHFLILFSLLTVTLNVDFQHCAQFDFWNMRLSLFHIFLFLQKNSTNTFFFCDL